MAYYYFLQKMTSKIFLIRIRKTGNNMEDCMKKYVLLLLALVLLIPSTVTAREKTLLGGQKLEHGGYGGPVFKFKSIKGDLSILSGGRGGWIINHTFVIGGGGYTLTNDISVDGNDLNMSYGGFELEYINRSDSVVHFTVHTGIGYGRVSFDDTDDKDKFFYVEPSVNAELNVLKWFRINAGGGYLFVNGIEDMPGLSDSDVGGIVGTVVLKFGFF
jgi:hypothetical protein